jgi:hypothetical protein
MMNPAAPGTISSSGDSRSCGNGLGASTNLPCVFIEAPCSPFTSQRHWLELPRRLNHTSQEGSRAVEARALPADSQSEGGFLVRCRCVLSCRAGTPWNGKGVGM